ncbi:ATP-binding protein [Streptomyces sp. NBC_00513]|uniref:ATP-binding protein n=1 Tax=unclassified Streptomyces TaxID=2593676 RepID=UPI0022599818|nr:ATP-binding protein [Streptomyces sp. NBC_00424]MCX5079273.1 ATP-binding protein [Streptomyces sp. NBC_00424]WUD39179.1 ATP-binding protein [Streptomyces sp. NBC_00513]
MTESGNPSQPANVNEYNASHIQVLEGREAIRRRPGMYIGSTSERGLHQMVFQVVSYAVDEHLAGHADTIDVTITADGGVRVADNGRGLPVEVEESTGKPAVERELTELSFGPKPHTGYSVSGGINGLGLCVVNALSSRLTVEVHRDGHRWTQAYEKGTPITPLTRNEETGNHGTAITFMPDTGIFETTHYSFATLSQRLQELAFLNDGLAISLTDERPEQPARYHHTDGLRAYVAHLNPYPLSLVHSPAIAFESENQDETISVQVAMQWNTWSPGAFRSFSNSTRTHEGGAHEQGFRTALTDLVNDYARRQQLLSADAENITVKAIHEGLTAVVSVKLAHPVFEGSTRTRLSNPEADLYVQEVVRKHLADWLDDHPDEAVAIIRHILNAST